MRAAGEPEGCGRKACSTYIATVSADDGETEAAAARSDDVAMEVAPGSVCVIAELVVVKKGIYLSGD
jgi:hypothetical protein